MKKTDATGARSRLILLDAHAILHRAYHALPDFSTAKGEPTGAIYGLSTMLIKIIEDLKPDYMVACYDVAAPTYRHEVYKEYKAGRAKTEDDLVVQMKRSRDIFTALGVPIYEVAGFEADDMLGTIVEQVTVGADGESGIDVSKRSVKKAGAGTKNLEIVIASGDMDTLQLVSGERVKVYTLKKGISDTIMYDEAAVNARYGFGPKLVTDYKGLRGDPSDNIPGIKGIGEKTATILITNFGTIEDIYKTLGAKNSEPKFLKAGLSPRIIQLLRDNEEEAQFSKMLATIRRDAPIKFKLPDKKFVESLYIKTVNKLWHELEFRTLGPRLEKAVSGGDGGKVGKKTGEKVAKNIDKNGISSDKEVVGAVKPARSQLVMLNSPGDFGEEDKQKNIEQNNKTTAITTTSPIPPDEFQKTAIALWLINSNVTQPTLDDILNFADIDTDIDPGLDVKTEKGQLAAFEQARTAIFKELEKRNLKKVYEEIELPLIPVVKRMEKRGVKIDRKILSNLAKTYHEEAARLEQEIWKHAGKEFNISSPKQLGEVLFDTLGLKIKNPKKTGAGGRSTRESELEKMRDMHPIIAPIFEFRELTKLLSTYIDAIPPLLDWDDRLHAKFIQTGTTTGRMASQEPNLQNIPIKTELGRAIRTAFIAGKGFKLCAFDYSQIELRIAAFMSGDKNMIDIFRSGEDFHTSVASRVFRVTPEEVTPEMRRHAKTINFGIIYGMGVTALKQGLGTSREEAQTFYNDYFKTFPELAAYLDGVKAETARCGYTETYFGRRRYFEGIKSKLPFIRAAAERMAINAPIQGTGADITKLALIKVEKFIHKEGLENDVFPIIQVHDELVYEIRTEEIAKLTEDIKEIMQTVIKPEKIQGIVLESSAHIGDNWGELK